MVELKRKLGIGLLALSVAGIATARSEYGAYDQPYEESVNSLEDRVARLERRMSGSTLIDMANQLDKLQADNQKLRGRVEELSHALDKTRKQLKDQVASLNEKVERVIPTQVATTAVTTPTPGTPVVPSTPMASTDAVATQAAPGSAANGVAAVAAGVVQNPPTSSPDASSTMTPAGQVAPVVPPPPPPPPPVTDPAIRQSTYEKAFATLKDGKYNDAIREFKNFIAVYPAGELADNAYYWLAEAYYVNRDFGSAKDNFRRMVTDFPKSSKVADASLKLGFIEYENGQYEAAKTLLNDVIKKYPDSSAAKMAEKRLERIRLEKH